MKTTNNFKQESMSERAQETIFSYQENIKINNISDITLERFLESQKQTIPLIDVIRDLFSYYQDKPLDEIMNYLNHKGIVGKGKNFEEIVRNLKINLPAAIISGTFTSRSDLACTKHSGLYLYDYDKIIENPLNYDDLLEFKDMLSRDPITLSVFISPSGMGLKQIIRGEIVEGEVQYVKEKHKENYLNIFSYLHNKYSIDLDTSCKNLSRATFTSSDCDIYINYDSEKYIVPVHSVNKSIDIFSIDNHQYIEGSNSENSQGIKRVTIKDSRESKDVKARDLVSQVNSSVKTSFDNPFEVKLSKTLISSIPYEIRFFNKHNKGLIIEMATKTIFILSEIIQYEHGKNMRNSFFKFIISMLDIFDPQKTRELASLFGCKEESYIEDTIKNFNKAQSNFIYIFCLALKHNINLEKILNEIRNENSNLLVTKKVLLAKLLNENYFVIRNEHNNIFKINKLDNGNNEISDNNQIIINDLMIDLEQRSKELKELSFYDLNGVLYSSLIKTYNPVKDFIDRLRDNNSKNCIRRLLTDCLKIPESTMYFNELVMIITKFLGSIFAKTLNSSQNDMMLILYGGMNLGKTRFLQSLFGYFAREENRSYFRVVDKISLKDNNDKDLLISNYIINIDEMIGFNDVEMKHVISLREINFRIPYELRMNTYQARCTLTGTTNNLEFLRDQENRRYIVLDITKKIDQDYLTDDVLNDIWYEAYQYYLDNGVKEIFLDDYEIQLVQYWGMNHKVETDLETIINDNFCIDDTPNYTTTEILNILKYLTNSSFDTKKLGMSLKRIFGESVTAKDKRKKYKCKLIDGSVLEKMSIQN